MNSHAFSGIIQKHRDSLHPVVPFRAGVDKLMAFDLSEQSEMFPPGSFRDIHIFSDRIFNYLAKNGARYGVGGYDEHRSVYSTSSVFDAASVGEEPRRLHLGMDIWGKPNTAVIAPLPGIIHSFANNDRAGDYGATLVLSHNLEGENFYTLYGHLSSNSIKNLREGDRVDAGDIIGEFGIPMENGHWPPHLHFQVILDLGKWKGDYPGVCKFSERAQYLANCPDPDFLLQMNRYINP